MTFPGLNFPWHPMGWSGSHCFGFSLNDSQINPRSIRIICMPNLVAVRRSGLKNSGGGTDRRTKGRVKNTGPLYSRQHL